MSKSSYSHKRLLDSLLLILNSYIQVEQLLVYLGPTNVAHHLKVISQSIYEVTNSQSIYSHLLRRKQIYLTEPPSKCLNTHRTLRKSLNLFLMGGI